MVLFIIFILPWLSLSQVFLTLSMSFFGSKRRYFNLLFWFRLSSFLFLTKFLLFFKISFDMSCVWMNCKRKQFRSIRITAKLWFYWWIWPFRSCFFLNFGGNNIFIENLNHLIDLYTWKLLFYGLIWITYFLISWYFFSRWKRKGRGEIKITDLWLHGKRA